MKLIKTWKILLCSAPLVFGACMGSDDGSDPRVSTQSAGDQEQASTPLSTASAPAGIGCSWQAASDPDNANIAFPDVYAKYWVAGVPATPGTRVRIKGKYPNARYFSFNAYDPALRPVDALADKEIAPTDGGSNPFVVEGGSAKEYEAFLVLGDSPTQNPDLERAANTFYSGAIAAGPLAVPNGPMQMIIYRIYLSREGEFFNGGVPLPELIVESADGSQVIGSLPNCDEPLFPTLGGNAPKLGLNEQLTGADYPDQLPSYYVIGKQEASTRKFFSIFETVYAIAQDRVEPLPDAPDQAPFSGGGGFLSNIHNAYTSTSFSRRYGSIAVVRMKVPSYRGASEAGFDQEQVRYWSVCGNEFTTQRFTDCVVDEEAVIGADGYVTVVVSDVADRPANITPENGFNWVPWGAYPDMVVIYRQMLPKPDFAEAIEYQPYGGDLRQGMGEYFPVGSYCDGATLSLSNDPKQAFELCQGFESDSFPIPIP